MLFGGLGGRGCRRGDDQAAPGTLHGRGSRLGGTGHGYIQFGLQLAFCKQPDAITRVCDHPGSGQRRLVDGLLGVQLAGIDGDLQAPQVHNHIAPPENVLKPALGQPPVERHLPALEALYGHATARFLTLVAMPGGLAPARANAPAQAPPRLAGTGFIRNLIQSHRTYFLFLGPVSWPCFSASRPRPRIHPQPEPDG